MMTRNAIPSSARRPRRFVAAIAFAVLVLSLAALIARDPIRRGPRAGAPGGRASSEFAEASSAPDPIFSGDLFEPMGVADSAYLAARPIPNLGLSLDDPEREELAKLMSGTFAEIRRARDEDRWFRAELAEGDRTWQVSIRPRGQLGPRWDGWRIRFDPGDPFYGVGEIDFIELGERSFRPNAVAMHQARALGLETPRDGFALLTVADSTSIAHYWIERPTAGFVEARGRPASSILHRPDQDGLGDRTGGRPGGVKPIYESLAWRDLLSSSPNQPVAGASLDNYLSTRELDLFERVTRIEDLLKLQAIEFVHGMAFSRGRPHFKLYFDPEHRRFEPIAWDFRLFARQESTARRSPEAGITGAAFKPDDFELLDRARLWIERDRYIWSLVRPGASDLAGAYNAIAEQSIEAMRGSDAPAAELVEMAKGIEAEREALASNVDSLRRALTYGHVSIEAEFADPGDADAIHVVEILNRASSSVVMEMFQIDQRRTGQTGVLKAYIDQDDDSLIGPADRLVGEFTLHGATDRLVLSFDEPLLFHSRRDRARTVSSAAVRLLLTGGTLAGVPERLHFGFANAVTQTPISPNHVWISIIDTNQAEDYAARLMSRSEFLEANPAFEADPADSGAVVLGGGEHVFRSDVIVPVGCELRVEPGARLRFGPRRSLICYGGLQAKGTEAEPITFEPSEPGAPWGVVAVVGPLAAVSRIAHARFLLSGEAEIANTLFTGGFSVHSAEVEVADCTFEAATADDAINFKYATGRISDCVFRDNSSDAIDLDWGAARIERCRFEANGGDAIDLSGAQNVIEHNLIFGSGDKGISVGERSSVVIFDNFIAGCDIGVAVKDLSQADIVATTLANNRIAIAAYRKKPVFGGGEARVLAGVVWDNVRVAAHDSLSSISFEMSVSEADELGGETNRIVSTAWAPAEDGSSRVDLQSDPGLRLTEAAWGRVRELLEPDSSASAPPALRGFVGRDDLRARMPSDTRAGELAP